MKLPPYQGYFSEYSLNDLAVLLRQKKVTSKQLILDSLKSIEKYNEELNAFTFVDKLNAIAMAEKMDELFDQGIDLSPLQGIPIAVKDNIDSIHLPSTMGSAFFKDHIACSDADCVRTIKDHGAIVIGKTNTNEFAYGPTGDCSFQGATKNVWDITKISGGSSCGSAVAVAAGMVPLALGTDTGGSIRIPSALNGVVGFKPTYAELSLKGVFPLSQTFDHVGFIAKSVEDISLTWNIFQGTNHQTKIKQPYKVAWVDIEGLFDTYDKNLYQELKAKAFDQFPNMEINQNLQKILIEVLPLYTVIQNKEAYEIHKDRLENSPQLFQIEVKERLEAASLTTHTEYLNALNERNQLIKKISKIFEEFDYVLMPTLPIQASPLHIRYINIDHQKVGVKEALLSLTKPWNVLGNPTLSIPFGFMNGLPIGLQVIAPQRKDLDVLNFAAHI